MNKDYQLEQLRRILMDPDLKSGLYLIDTDLSDSDIEIIIGGVEECRYIKEPLMPSKNGSPFDLFVTGLSYKCESDEIRELRKYLMFANSQQKEIILYNLLISMMESLSSEHITFIHLCGECDLTVLSHEDLCKLNEASIHHGQKIVMICKNKSYNSSEHDPRITLINLVGAQKMLSKVETQIDQKYEPLQEVARSENTTAIQNGASSLIMGTIIMGLGTSTNNSCVRNEAYFDNIANRIINDLDKARVSIHVCMAWFTNQRIADKLIEKYQEGVDVKVVSFDDHTNAKFGVNIGDIPHRMIRGSRGGTMHNKFCVIDNQIVITGSYNWSENAENKNDENAAVMYDNDKASDYSVEFRRLYGM